jgi:dolichol-phosphate mannosyltransferase
MQLSIVIPAYNEEKNIGTCLESIREVVGNKHHIPYELVVVDDCSRDGTADQIRAAMRNDANIRMVERTPPGGFGRAIRAGLEAATGDAVVICMSDLSDDPEDIVAYYRKLEEGYDCVFGSRFIAGAKVESYPRVKLIVNRIVNRMIQLLFWTRFNDLSNAFKAYRMAVIRDCGPYRASHFNITIEMSLSALIRGYNIAQIPIRWYGREWGSTNLRLGQMGRKYLCTMLMLFFQRLLIADDLLVERLASAARGQRHLYELQHRVKELEDAMAQLRAGDAAEAPAQPTTAEDSPPATALSPESARR